jgi:hypothetical protein
VSEVQVKKTPDLIEAILAQLKLGKSVRSVCVETGISTRQLWHWMASDDDLTRRFMQAKEIGVYSRINEMHKS